MADFTVKTAQFEGPLDLLLNLIEAKKLHISQVSLAQVADDFIAHLQGFSSQDGEQKNQMANFILVAATLMLIKSLSLLPNLTPTEEEAGDMAELERRLELYRRIKELSRHVQKAFGRAAIFSRERSLPGEPLFTPTAELVVPALAKAMRQVIKSFPQPEKLPQVLVKKMISLEEVINQLSNRIRRALRLDFKDFVKGRTERVEIIVSFLGLLELVKHGLINVQQSEPFQNIAMETTEVDTPRY